jgi:cell division protease FtsH
MENKARPPLQKSMNWRLILWFVILGFFFLYFSKGFNQPQRMKISYSHFKNLVSEGEISKVTVKGEQIFGTFKKPQTQKSSGSKEAPGSSKESSPEYKSFETVMPSFGDPELLGQLEKQNVTIEAETQQRSWFWSLIIGFLPWLLIIGFFVYSSKKLRERMGGLGGGGPFGFGKSKAKLYTKSASDVTYDDVAGLANPKKELQEVVEFLKNPSKYSALGGELPRGILLVGPPGTGKTLMARATAGEAGVPFYSISGSEFIEMFVGVGASRVRDMFNNAKKDAPSIIFIDEIDSIGRVRGTGLGGGHDEREQTLNQILSEMDGFAPHESVVVMAATNRPDVLDPALVRPGRFDRQITLELPQKKARREILAIHAKKVTLADDVDLNLIADRTVGFSGAELRNLVNEAALLAGRKGKNQVEEEDFDEGRDKIIMGVEREDLMSDEEKEVIAYHESGHALMAKLLPGSDPLDKVTIIPRGRSLGATEQIPSEDRHNLKRSYLLNRVAIMLGGRAAERVVFEETTSGAGDDLKKATQLVRRMVCQWGMSDRLGPVAYRQGETHPFLGREMAEPKDFSEETARLIDDEIRRITKEMEEKAEETLKSNREQLDALARALLEHETVSREDVDKLLSPYSHAPEQEKIAKNN